jgi:hypothetical protein
MLVLRVSSDKQEDRTLVNLHYLEIPLECQPLIFYRHFDSNFFSSSNSEVVMYAVMLLSTFFSARLRMLNQSKHRFLLAYIGTHVYGCVLDASLWQRAARADVDQILPRNIKQGSKVGSSLVKGTPSKHDSCVPATYAVSCTDGRDSGLYTLSNSRLLSHVKTPHFCI